MKNSYDILAQILVILILFFMGAGVFLSLIYLAIKVIKFAWFG